MRAYPSPPIVVCSPRLTMTDRQFGNMLVLAAAYQSPRLREFVDRERLEELLLRTIRVLSDHKEISPTLSKDAEILEVIRKSLPSSLDPTESFSSHDS